MARQSDPLIIGQALFVDGAVKAESINGVSQVIKPNGPIHFGDRIDTGSDGSVSILLSGDNASQLDLGRMSQIIIDEDVAGGSIPDLGDVTVEAGLVADLLQDWETTTPVETLGTISPGSEVSELEETADADSIPDLEDISSTVASSDSGDDGVGSIDDDLDLSYFIPPPEDTS
jgi:hypothetical protein